MKYYKIDIAGLQRELPIFKINDNLSIAAFILFGDTEITIAAASELLKKVPEFDVILTPEAKSIPLAYEMSRQCGKSYIVARKGPKLYMLEPFSVEVDSITTENRQKLFLGKLEADQLKGKRVLIVDDVISTGASLTAIKQLIEKAGGTVAASCSVLAEGEAAKRDDIIYLNSLPLIKGD